MCAAGFPVVYVSCKSLSCSQGRRAGGNHSSMGGDSQCVCIYVWFSYVYLLAAYAKTCQTTPSEKKTHTQREVTLLLCHSLQSHPPPHPTNQRGIFLINPVKCGKSRKGEWDFFFSPIFNTNPRLPPFHLMKPTKQKHASRYTHAQACSTHLSANILQPEPTDHYQMLLCSAPSLDIISDIIQLILNL